MQILLSSAQPYALSDGHKLRKFALSKGITKAQLKGIAQEELDKNGNHSYEAIKYWLAGWGTMIFMALIAVISLLLSNPPIVGIQYAIPGGFFAIGVFMVILSGKERTAAAVAAAVLRQRAHGYSNTQISIFKDQPEFKNCDSTMSFLDSLKDDTDPQVACATT